MDRFLACYQLLYGVLGTVLNTYNLLTASAQTVQTYLALVVVLAFSVWVLVAGVAQYRQWPAWPWLVLPGQFLQVADWQVGDLSLQFRCGFSVNVLYQGGLVKSTLDPTDIGSAIAWQMPLSTQEGLNLVALFVCVLVFISLFEKKTSQSVLV
jgi:hypothetical protein